MTGEGRHAGLMSAHGPPAAAPCVVLAFDYGTRRIGVALGNTLTGSARPLAVLDAADAATRLADAAALVEQWQAQQVIVGLPVHADGTAHAMTRRAAAFARDLAARVSASVETADERHTTELAQQRLATERAGRSGRERRDAVAAQLILEGWLDARGK